MVADLLAPVFALVIWSLVMLLWMIARRVALLKTLPKDVVPKEAMVGGRGSDLEKLIPGPAHWPAHNYAHLMEQPTIFYATAIGLAVLGAANPVNVALAWAYVGIRIVHSIWQATVNTIPLRAGLWFLSSGVLLALAIRAMVAVLCH